MTAAAIAPGSPHHRRTVELPQEQLAMMLDVSRQTANQLRKSPRRSARWRWRCRRAPGARRL